MNELEPLFKTTWLRIIIDVGIDKQKVMKNAAQKAAFFFGLFLCLIQAEL